MSQSKTMSFVETMTNQVVGFAISVTILIMLGPYIGIVGAGIQNGFVMTAILTVLSIIRMYVLRRIFDWTDRRKDNDADLFV